MTFNFNAGIPAANNNPSNDQPDMLTNNISTNAILAIDHVSFNDANGGKHKQITYVSKNTPGAQTDPSSTEFTADAATLPSIIGSASVIAQTFFRNQNGTFPLNAIKAGGVFTTVNNTGVPVTITPDMSFNVDSVAKIGVNANARIYTINLIAGAVIGTTVIVFTNMNTDQSITWTYALNTLTLTIPVGAATAGNKISFQILQV